MTAPTELDERALNEALEVARHNTGDNGKEVAIRAYLSALPASEAGWRDIESAPKGVDILVGGPFEGEWEAAVYKIRDEYWREDWDEEPTHWMPLPSAPDRRAGE